MNFTYRLVNFDHPFISRLKLQPKPPKNLWQIGKLPSESVRPKVVSIVGSRRCTPYGAKLAFDAAKRLAEEGAVIVSGLAYGIDAQAHRGCLDAGGRTVAVLGTAIDQIYPATHRALAEQIIRRGAIISEYPPGEPTRNWHFLERNRLVAGLSDVLFVVEASDHSGTLTTVKEALERNVEVFVAPGDLTRPMSVGCNALIRDGAQVYTAPEDILRYLFPRRIFGEAKDLTRLSGDEYRVIKQLHQGIHDASSMLKNLAITPSALNKALSVLELRGLVVPHGANQWGLIKPTGAPSKSLKKIFAAFHGKED